MHAFSHLTKKLINHFFHRRRNQTGASILDRDEKCLFLALSVTFMSGHISDCPSIVPQAFIIFYMASHSNLKHWRHRALCELLINMTAIQTVQGHTVIQTCTILWLLTFLLPLGTGTGSCRKMLWCCYILILLDFNWNLLSCSAYQTYTGNVNLESREKNNLRWAQLS